MFLWNFNLITKEIYRRNNSIATNSFCHLRLGRLELRVDPDGQSRQHRVDIFRYYIYSYCFLIDRSFSSMNSTLRKRTFTKGH